MTVPLLGREQLDSNRYFELPYGVHQGLKKPNSTRAEWFVYRPLSVLLVASSQREHFGKTFEHVTDSQLTGDDDCSIRPPDRVLEEVKYGGFLDVDDGEAHPRVYLVGRERWLGEDPGFVYVFTHKDVLELDYDPREDSLDELGGRFAEISENCLKDHPADIVNFYWLPGETAVDVVLPRFNPR